MRRMFKDRPSIIRFFPERKTILYICEILSFRGGRMTTSPLLSGSSRGESPSFIELSSEPNRSASLVKDDSDSQISFNDHEKAFPDENRLIEECQTLLGPTLISPLLESSFKRPIAHPNVLFENEHKSPNNEILQKKEHEKSPVSPTVQKTRIERESKKEVEVLFRELLDRDSDRSLFLTFAGLCENSNAASASEEILALQTLGWIDSERKICYKQEFDRLLAQHCENNLRTLVTQIERVRLPYVFNEIMKGSSDSTYDWMGPKWRGPAWVSSLWPIKAMREREKNRVLVSLKRSGLMNGKNQLITSSKIQAVLLEKFPGHAVCPLNQNSSSCFSISLPTWQDLCNLIQDLIGLGRRSRS